MDMFYVMLRVQEQLYYISVVAEFFNIFSVLGVIFGFNLPPAFFQVLGAVNFIYFLYISLIALAIRGEFRKISLILLPLIFIRRLGVVSSRAVLLAFSIFAIGSLIKYHSFLYVALPKKSLDETRKD